MRARSSHPTRWDYPPAGPAQSIRGTGPSGFRPCAVSTAGAMGLMQIMPDTAGDLGLTDPFDPSANVNAGAKYLKQMLERYHGNTALALAAYNAGPGRTDRADGAIPEIPETIGYVASILSNIPLF